MVGLRAVDSAGLPGAAISVEVEGIPAAIRSITPAAGYPDGYSVIEVVAPLGAPDDDFLPVIVRADAVLSQAGVTVALR